MNIGKFFKTPGQAHAENYYPWRFYSGQELRGAGIPRLLPSIWSFIWMHSCTEFQSVAPLLLLRRMGCRPSFASRFRKLFAHRKELAARFKQDWGYNATAYRWINEMPDTLYNELSAGRDPFQYFDSWYAYHRMSLKDGPETVKLCKRSPYRHANKVARQERRALIETRWNARTISRATVKAKGQARVGRL